jgi:hypothetical protein
VNLKTGVVAGVAVTAVVVRRTFSGPPKERPVMLGTRKRVANPSLTSLEEYSRERENREKEKKRVEMFTPQQRREKRRRKKRRRKKRRRNRRRRKKEKKVLRVLGKQPNQSTTSRSICKTDL